MSLDPLFAMPTLRYQVMYGRMFKQIILSACSACESPTVWYTSPYEVKCWKEHPVSLFSAEHFPKVLIVWHAGTCVQL